MTIQTKFDVHDLVQHKYQREGIEHESVAYYEVLESVAQTCYGGTQIFYKVRAVFKVYKTNYESGKAIRNFMNVGHSMKKHNEGYLEFREDELKPLPEYLVKEIKNEQ